ncbi:MAG: IS3 family transposase, partial [Acutalibacteraceae bacterium]
TKEELEASVAEYIEFYNEGRPHRKLNMKTPAQFEAEYFSALNAK